MTPTTYATDPRTGLPVLPKGYFWRISACHSYYNSRDRHHTMEIRKASLLWSRQVCGPEIVLTDKKWDTHGSSYRQRLMYKANILVSRFLNKDSLDDYLGDYPPKQLPRG